MNHFPNARPRRLAGLHLEHARQRPRIQYSGPALLCAAFYAAGFITGAILFGELLLALHR